MKNLFLIIALTLLVGCKATLPIVPVVLQDSIHTKVLTEKVVHYIDTIIYVDVPVESKQTVVQDSSYLETSVAASTAKINKDGLLYHSLQNKTVQLAELAQIKYVYETKDSIVYIEKEIPVNVPVEVEKDLNWFQNAAIKSGIAFWVLLLGWCYMKLRKFLPIP